MAPDLAFLEIMVLWVSILATIVLFYPIHSGAALVLSYHTWHGSHLPPRSTSLFGAGIRRHERFSFASQAPRGPRLRLRASPSFARRVQWAQAARGDDLAQPVDELGSALPEYLGSVA